MRSKAARETGRITAQKIGAMTDEQARAAAKAEAICLIAKCQEALLGYGHESVQAQKIREQITELEERFGIN